MHLGIRKLWLGSACAAFLSIVSGASGALTVYSNTNVITINDNFSPPTKATPYPSAINVTGLTGQVVTKATVTLHGLTHAFPSDIYILLVGPQGQRTILIAEVGGTDFTSSVTNLTLTLDDDAPSSLPVTSNLVSGTFKPTDGYTLTHPSLPFNFPPPAPPGTSNTPAALWAFRNTDPNGAWNLFVVDNSGGATGIISGGWTLTLSTGYALGITRAAPNVVLSWSTNAPNCRLQASGNLSDPNSWRYIITIPAVISGQFVVTNPVLYEIDYYRLVPQ